MKNFIETVKANKKVIIKRALIAGAVVTTVVVVGALYKAGKLEDVTVPDLEVTEK